jgi:hypothetical protein
MAGFYRQQIVAMCLIALLFCLPSVKGFAQSPFTKFGNLFTVPLNYVVPYSKTSPVIDGDINDAIWQQAKWTADFQDIEGGLKPRPTYQTRAKMLWDGSCLYIAAEVKDPQIWATLKKHDSIIFNDNDFEVFINPNNSTHQYFEMEFNAYNTLWDLFLNKPYRNNGSAMFGWNAEGLRSAVKIQGTINDADDTDKGWTVEIAIPFKSLTIGNLVTIPKEGTLWRMNFSRVEWDTKVVDGKYLKLKDANGRNLPEHNWVWSPQGLIEMHYPERWGYLQFTKQDNTVFALPYTEQQKQYLWLLYYQEKLWFKEHHAYKQSLFDLSDNLKVDGRSNTLKIEATDHQFIALITDSEDNKTWSINQDGLVTN